jgi:hypothetical protein
MVRGLAAGASPTNQCSCRTWILSGIDARGVKRSLSQRQKGVQVYDTQIMLCDKRQCSWPRGLATSPYHKRPVFLLIFSLPSAVALFVQWQFREREHMLNGKEST